MGAGAEDNNRVGMLETATAKQSEAIETLSAQLAAAAGAHVEGAAEQAAPEHKQLLPLGDPDGGEPGGDGRICRDSNDLRLKPLREGVQRLRAGEGGGRRDAVRTSIWDKVGSKGACGSSRRPTQGDYD